MTVKRSKLISDTDLSALLKAYEEGTETDGRSIKYLHLSSFLIRQFDELLPDAFTVSPHLDRATAISLFRRAVREARLAGPLTGETIRVRAEEIDRRDRAVTARRYTMWTKFRASSMAHSKGFMLKLDGVTLRTTPRLPDWLHTDEYFLSGFGRINPKDPEFYGFIILHCNDRSVTVAATRMLDAAQLIFGLFNLYEGYGRWSLRMGRPWADGKLWLGPYQFVFRERSSLAKERIWYNPDFDNDAWASNVASMYDILAISPKVRRAISAIDAHPLKEILTRSIRLMQDGFSARDANHRILRYWSALEQLYVEESARERSNQKVINRASFAERDPRLSRWTLTHISRLRNDYVHAGGGAEELEAMSQFLRDLLTRHIIHWIFMGSNFRSHHELLQYVDLPRDVSALKKMRDAVDRRISLSEAILR